ncbi:MAG: HPr family phosphocarrier protein [Firmicutes bacterium]|nr:HPr family phosphocarrier protein [Bacillota bacterium]
MKAISVLLNTIDKVRNFVTAVSPFPGELDLKSGRYTVDAKSIMGIFSLDLSRPMDLLIHENAENPDLDKAIQPFLAPMKDVSDKD